MEACTAVSASSPPLDLQALRQAAQAATPGPWHVRPQEMDDWGYVRGPGMEVVAQARAGGRFTTDDYPAHRNAGTDPFGHNAAHIAAFDPPTALALLNRLEAAEQALAAKEVGGSAAGWRPMADAPKDKTPIDVWIPDDEGGYRVTGLKCNSSGGLIDHRGCTADLLRWPTHWMPILPPPALSSGGAG